MLPYPRLSDSPDSLAKPLHVEFSSLLNCRGSNYIGGLHFFSKVYVCLGGGGGEGRGDMEIYQTFHVFILYLPPYIRPIC